MKEKKVINNLNNIINNYDRVFISGSVFLENENDLLNLNFKPRSVILNSETITKIGVQNECLNKLFSKGVLITKDNTIIRINTTYDEAAKKLYSMNKYKMILLTNNEAEGFSFKELLYKQNPVRGSNAYGFNKNEETFEYVYLPPKENVKFKLITKENFKKIRVYFFDIDCEDAKRSMPLYNDDTYTTANRISSNEFEFVIDKSLIIDADLISFAVETEKSELISSEKQNVDLDRTQSWEIYLSNLKIYAMPVVKSKEDDEQSGSPETFDIPINDVFPYYGGTKAPDMENILIKVTPPEVGDTVYNSSQKPIKLVKKLGDGGEGTVYRTDKKGIVAKIYRNQTLTTDKQKRIEYMTSVNLNMHQLTWPIESLYCKGKFVGFTMPEASGTSLFLLVRNREIQNYNRTQIVKMIISILETIVYLHKRNIIIGDIKMQNLMLNKEDISDITFVDCDSMQIDKYQSLVTTVEFTAPENVGKDTKKYYTTFESENYSLFVLLFYIIMAGAHPYSQIVSTNSEEISFNEKVRRGMFPYFSEDATNKYGNFTVRLNWAYLPGYLRNAFINVGYYRGENFAKEKRLSSQEWLTLFKKYYEDLTNGRLKAIDSKYNVGVYEPWPRAIPSEVYKKFDIKQFMQISSREQGFKLDLVVNKLLNNANLDLITYDPYNIVKLLKRKDIYKKDKLTIMLKKNLGFYYDLMLEYEKCE